MCCSCHPNKAYIYSFTSADDIFSFLGKTTFRKSSSHVLGQAAELQFNCLLYFGAVTDGGFFYEIGRTSDSSTSTIIEADDRKCLEEIAGQVITAKQKFERLVVSKENLLEIFKHNKYRVHFISSIIADGASFTVYRCGPFIDLCVGPHMRDTGKIGVFEIEKVRGSQESTLRAATIYSLRLRLEISTRTSLVFRGRFGVPYLRHQHPQEGVS